MGNTSPEEQSGPGVVGSASMEAFESCGDVALRDAVSGHSAMGWGWRRAQKFYPASLRASLQLLLSHTAAILYLISCRTARRSQHLKATIASLHLPPSRLTQADVRVDFRFVFLIAVLRLFCHRSASPSSSCLTRKKKERKKSSLNIFCG